VLHFSGCVTQWLELLALNQRVGGSNPSASTSCIGYTIWYYTDMNTLTELDRWRIKRRLEFGEDIRSIAGVYKVYWKALKPIQRELEEERRSGMKPDGKQDNIPDV
jgi:hypothetical protein